MKKGKIVLLLAAAALLYLIIGATAPFFQRKPVSAGYQQQAEQMQFYGEGTGPDRAMLVETNEAALYERLRLISMAREEIILATFDMRDGESTRDVLAALLDAADRGVKVRLLVDGVSTALRMEGRAVFYALSAQPNVEIRSYNPLNLLLPWKTQGRMHDKYVIVDQTAYLLGGRNTFDYFLGEYPTEHRSLDREVLIYNTQWREQKQESSLFALREYFEGVWALPDCKPFHDSEELLEQAAVRKEEASLRERFRAIQESCLQPAGGPEDYERETVETGKVTLLSNPTSIYGKEPWVFYSLQALMSQARERVVIQSPYAVCDSFMYDSLRELSEKVPEVKLMINSVENGDNLMASSDYHFQKGKLLDTGIALYEYDGGSSFHGKSVLIDGDLSVIGSYNLDMRSTYVDTELMLVIHSETLNEQLEACMEAMEQDCRKAVSVKEYETPEHLQIQTVSAGKRAMFYMIGFLLQFFRYLV